MNRRQTHQKELILSLIQGKGIHMTADEVLQKVQEVDPKIGLATIYRNLNLFVEEKKIQKVSGEGWSYYDGNPSPHDHFRCIDCGKLEDIEAPYDMSLDQTIERKCGGKVLRHSTTYEGICKDCEKKRRN